MTQITKRYQKGALYELNISTVYVESAPTNSKEKKAVTELSATIAKTGDLLPVLVRRDEKGKFQVVAGEARYKAARNAGMITIPALVTGGNPEEVRLMERLLMEDLTPLEETEAIIRLKNQYGYQLSDLSCSLGKAESTLCEMISLAKLPEVIKEECGNDLEATRKRLEDIFSRHSLAKAPRERSKAELGTTGSFTPRGESDARAGRPAWSDSAEAQQALVQNGYELIADVHFLGRCAKLIEALETESLQEPFASILAKELERVGAVTREKLQRLKTEPER